MSYFDRIQKKIDSELNQLKPKSENQPVTSPGTETVRKTITLAMFRSIGEPEPTSCSETVPKTPCDTPMRIPQYTKGEIDEFVKNSSVPNPVINGVETVPGDRVLLTQQTDPVMNNRIQRFGSKIELSAAHQYARTQDNIIELVLSTGGLDQIRVSVLGVRGQGDYVERMRHELQELVRGNLCPIAFMVHEGLVDNALRELVDGVTTYLHSHPQHYLNWSSVRAEALVPSPHSDQSQDRYVWDEANILRPIG